MTIGLDKVAQHGKPTGQPFEQVGRIERRIAAAEVELTSSAWALWLAVTKARSSS